MALDDKTKEELKQKYGDSLIKVRAPDDSWIVFRRPDSKQWTEVTDKLIRDRDSKTVLFKKLVLECAVYPSTGEMANVLDTWPAYATSCFNELAKHAGQTDELEVSKL